MNRNKRTRLTAIIGASVLLVALILPLAAVIPASATPRYTDKTLTDISVITSYEGYGLGRYFVYTSGIDKGQKIFLEKKTARGYVKVKSAKVKIVDSKEHVGLVVFRIKKNSLTSKKTTYRVRYAGTKNSTKSATTFVVKGTNKKHRGYENKASKYIKKWCPGVPVYVSTRLGGFNGQAVFEYGGRGRDYAGATYILVRPGLSSRDLQSTMLHECAHIIQYRVMIRRGGWDAWYSTKGYAKRGGTPQMEIEADCMAKAMNRNVGFLYYTAQKPCSRAEVAKSAKVLRKYGHIGKGLSGSYRTVEIRRAFR